MEYFRDICYTAHFNFSSINSAIPTYISKILYMTGRSVNIYLQEDTYNQLRKLTGSRKISRFVDEAIIEKLTKEQERNEEELRQKMIAGYKANAKNKKLQAELGVWEKISAQDALTQIEKNERKKGKKS